MTETDTAPTPPTTPVRRGRRARTAAAAVGTFGIAGAAAFGMFQAAQPATVAGSASPAQSATQPAEFVPGYGRFGAGGFSDGTGSTGTTPSATTTAATAAQQVGIVEINTVLQYQNAAAAGTGMVLTPDGEILTNNHVVDGATSITVTISSTGVTYTATVVGTDPTDDVAVLQLADASGLLTANLSTDAAVLGEAVTGVGNAGGTGTLTAAEGTVTALDQDITASDETGSDAEQLTGLIETDAAIQAGDSGGPLYGSDGAIIGMDTAASSGGTPEGYAIPIDTATAIAAQIESGVDDATIHQGYPAFLGVSLQDGAAGAAVAGALSDGPAADAGITAGSVITSVGGTPVGSATDLASALAGYEAGDRVSIGWTTVTGTSASASVTLAAGPAD
jgi:S1-C subfamily serine protease